MLIGNKKDLVESDPSKREVRQKDITAFCKEYNLQYHETSAKTGTNVEVSFVQLVQAIYDTGPTNPANSTSFNRGVSLDSKNGGREYESDSGCC